MSLFLGKKLLVSWEEIMYFLGRNYQFLGKELDFRRQRQDAQNEFFWQNRLAHVCLPLCVLRV